jgi:cobalamin biosynthesis protein CobT
VKITQMLSGKGIKVTQQGVNAYVKADHLGTPVVVNLPYLPDNATEELCNAIQGFLDHEVAHILFTNFPLMAKANAHGRQIGFMLNALEDPRIEKEMAQRFQGSAYNLSVTGKFYLDKFVMPRLKEKAAAGDANGVIQTLMVPMIRAMSGQQVFQEFMKDHWAKMDVVYKRIEDLQPQIEGATSTQDCLDLAIEIGKRLSDGSKGKSGKSKDKSEDDEGSGTGSSSGKSGKSKEKPEGKSSKSKGKSAPPPTPEEDEDDDKGTAADGEGEEDKKEEGEGAGGEGESEKKDDEKSEGKSDKKEKSEKEPESEAEPEPETEPDPEDDDEDETDIKDADEEEEGDDAASTMTEGSMGEGESDADDELGDSAPIWAELDKDGKNGYDESMSRALSESAMKSAQDADYMPFTKDFDVIEKLPVGSSHSAAMTQRLADAVDHMVAPLQKDLERAIAARSLATRSHGHRSGKLHAANLSRLRFNDDRVFSRKHESTSKDVAVQLVVDCSGSMNGSKIHTAAQAAYALSAVLERLNIKNEVIGFTTKEIGGSALKELNDTTRSGSVRFSRVEGLYMPIMKGYEERMTANVKDRFAWLPNTNILRSNVDGESVEIAARRLLARREESKVMLVLSDGYPAAAGHRGDLEQHLKRTVKDIASSGVRIVGIGIQSNAVEKFYPKSLVINNVGDLPAVVIKELRHLLMV